MSLLGRASRRQLLRHPWQIGLATLGIALGVAVVVAIDLANESAQRAFDLSTAAMTGRTTHQVFGGALGIPDAVYTELRVRKGLTSIAPVVEGYIGVRGTKGARMMRLVGVDPLADAPFRSWLGSVAPGAPGRASRAAAPSLAALMTEPGAVLLASGTATALGIAPGERFRARAGARRLEARLAGVIAPVDAASAHALDDVVLADISVAQELLGQEGRLTRIDLIAPTGAAREPWLAAVRSTLPPGDEIVDASARASNLGGMTAAFRLNLQALSLLALVCGMFLIYNTMVFSVVQRRPLIGMLRAVGVTRTGIFRMVLGEAARVGVVGTALGIALGTALGQGLVQLVARTINDLYFTLNVGGATLGWFTVAKGVALGIGATLLAALAPAFEATMAVPRATLTRSAIEESARRAVPRAAGVGFVLLAAGGALIAWPSRSLVLAFAGLFAMLIGCALLAPIVTVAMARIATPVLGYTSGALGRMAARGVTAALSRTAVAIAALMIAVSVTVGVGVMIRSFRSTVVLWLGTTLSADIFMSGPDVRTGRTDVPLDPALVARLTGVPGIAGVNTLRSVRLETATGPITLQAVGIHPLGRASLVFKEGDPNAVWPAFDRGDALIVSEPFAYRRGLRAGDTLTLPTAHGPRAFPVAGVIYGYGSDQGVVMIAAARYRALWDDPSISALAVFAAPGVSVDDLADRLRTAAGPDAILSIQSNRALRAGALQVFDRTFTITSVLRLLVALVSFIGVLTALLALALERGRELAVLRAGGLSPAQVWQLVITQSGLMGLAAGLLAVPVGLLQAAMMIYVINKRSFGWTLRMTWEPRVLLEAVALAVLASLLAGLYPAWKMSRTSPALALRDE